MAFIIELNKVFFKMHDFLIGIEKLILKFIQKGKELKIILKKQFCKIRIKLKDSFYLGQNVKAYYTATVSRECDINRRLDTQINETEQKTQTERGEEKREMHGGDRFLKLVHTE